MAGTTAADTVLDMSTDVENYTKTQLKRDREWTDAAITKFLGEPDGYADNPYSSRTQIHLYDAERVYAVEGTREFAEWREKSRARRAGARKAVETKRAKTMAVVKQRLGKVRLRKHAVGLTEEKLRERAVSHYNDMQESRAYEYDYDFDPVGVEGAPDEFYARIEVNYLRHQGTKYDTELDNYIGATGVRDAVDMVREHVYALIAAEYPHLKGECERQLEDRRNMGAQRQAARGGRW